MWRELLREYQVTDIASSVHRDRFGCWGFLDLWRLGGSPPQFTEPEKAFLAWLAPDLTAAFDLLQSKYRDNYPSFITFITGPSRTGDIERILVLGAHGPKNLTVILIR